MNNHVIWIRAHSVEAVNYRVDRLLDYVLEELIEHDADPPREQMKRNLEDRKGIWVDIGDTDRVYVLTERTDTNHRDGTPVREGLEDLLEEENTENVVIPTVYVESVAFIDDIVSSGAHVHFEGTGITVHGDAEKGIGPVIRRSLRRLTGDRRDAAAIVDGIPHSGGRPPIGCRVEDGVLRPGEDYYRVCETLQDVKDGVTPKVEAADKIDCSRKTIDNALERTELYQID